MNRRTLVLLLLICVALVVLILIIIGLPPPPEPPTTPSAPARYFPAASFTPALRHTATRQALATPAIVRPDMEAPVAVPEPPTRDVWVTRYTYGSLMAVAGQDLSERIVATTIDLLLAPLWLLTFWAGGTWWLIAVLVQVIATLLLFVRLPYPWDEGAVRGAFAFIWLWWLLGICCALLFESRL